MLNGVSGLLPLGRAFAGRTKGTAARGTPAAGAAPAAAVSTVMPRRDRKSRRLTSCVMCGPSSLGVCSNDVAARGSCSAILPQQPAPAQEVPGTSRLLYNWRGRTMHGLRRVLAGLGRALHARRGTFVGVAAAVFALDILIPPLVLSVARARVDYFTFNPWLPSLPGYLRTGPGTLGERLDRAVNLALFWFSADGIFGVDWGFAVTTVDLARFALMAVLVGPHFPPLRDPPAPPPPPPPP